MAEMKDAAFVEKLNKGPVALLTVIPNGPFNMGRSLGLWTWYQTLPSPRWPDLEPYAERVKDLALPTAR